MKEKVLNKESIISRDSNLIFSEIDGDIVLLSIENNNYYGLDEIGSIIWNMIETPYKLSEIINILTQQYDVDYSQCLEDVSILLNDLHKDGLINIFL
jgi:hypothetical protein